MAGLDLPGAVVAPDRSFETLRIVLGAILTVVGIGGILLLARRRAPLSMA
jgi:hypothetical protein